MAIASGRPLSLHTLRVPVAREAHLAFWNVQPLHLAPVYWRGRIVDDYIERVASEVPPAAEAADDGAAAKTRTDKLSDAKSRAATSFAACVEALAASTKASAEAVLAAEAEAGALAAARVDADASGQAFRAIEARLAADAKMMAALSASVRAATVAHYDAVAAAKLTLAPTPVQEDMQAKNDFYAAYDEIVAVLSNGVAI